MTPQLTMLSNFLWGTGMIAALILYLINLYFKPPATRQVEFEKFIRLVRKVVIGAFVWCFFAICWGLGLDGTLNLLATMFIPRIWLS